MYWQYVRTNGKNCSAFATFYVCFSIIWFTNKSRMCRIKEVEELCVCKIHRIIVMFCFKLCIHRCHCFFCYMNFHVTFCNRFSAILCLCLNCNSIQMLWTRNLDKMHFPTYARNKVIWRGRKLRWNMKLTFAYFLSSLPNYQIVSTKFLRANIFNFKIVK